MDYIIGFKNEYNELECLLDVKRPISFPLKNSIIIKSYVDDTDELEMNLYIGKRKIIDYCVFVKNIDISGVINKNISENTYKLTVTLRENFCLEINIINVGNRFNKVEDKIFLNQVYPELNETNKEDSKKNMEEDRKYTDLIKSKDNYYQYIKGCKNMLDDEYFKEHIKKTKEFKKLYEMVLLEFDWYLLDDERDKEIYDNRSLKIEEEFKLNLNALIKINE